MESFLCARKGYRCLEGIKEGHTYFLFPFLYLKTCCISSLDWWPHMCLSEGGARSHWAPLFEDEEVELPCFLFCSPLHPSGKASPVGFPPVLTPLPTDGLEYRCFAKRDRDCPPRISSGSQWMNGEGQG